ncbi:MAG TPA: DUF6537 domain-containing protein, partial [Acetobacteraceae bacterium]|nr:DUF6537 domain-containing protein [Acetobacteraceae bacterium]
TFKILVNDAVAMTGGQPAEGAPTAAGIARQLAAEGVGRIALVADEASRLPAARALPPGTTRHTREALDAVQRELRDWAGVSALVYDQVCAAEKRRRRKRGRMQPAATRVAINARVCENCGDCTAQSGCIAIEPVATEYGRKRRISPTACNTDLSCLKGFCPSFVTMPATAPAGDAPAEDAWAAREATLAAALPAPDLPRGTRVWRGLFAGIGGQGIVTTGAILAMAAHLEGRDASTLDFTGLAQKNGAVVAHVQIGAAPVADGVPVEVLRSAPIDVVRSAPIDVVRSAPIDVVRIPRGEADLLLAGDLAVGASADVLSRCRGDAAVIGNLDLQANLEFLAHADLPLDAARHRRAIERVADPQRTLCLHATALAERLFGSAQLANTLLLGAAWQRGLLPVGEAALRRAIALNGTAVALNHRAFLWGRILARNAALAAEILGEAPAAPRDLAALVEARAGELAAYQDEGLAARYRSLVAQAASREAAVGGAGGALARAVAEGFFHLLAVKDEYEVARLHAVQAWPRGARFYLAPPLLSRTDPATGRRRKVAVPGWLALPLFRALRHGKHLRGTALDPFGRQAERRLERRLAEEYEADLRRALDGLTAAHLPTAVALARLPLAIRGFGPVKQASAERAAAERRVLLDRLAAPAAMAAE